MRGLEKVIAKKGAFSARKHNNTTSDAYFGEAIDELPHLGKSKPVTVVRSAAHQTMITHSATFICCYKCQHSRSAEQHVLRAFGNHAASKRASVITKVPSFSE